MAISYSCCQRHDLDHSYILLSCLILVVNGNWSSWGEWSKCSELCDGGDRERTRECNNPTPSNSGEECKGADKQEELCNTHPCPGR